MFEQPLRKLVHDCLSGLVEKIAAMSLMAIVAAFSMLGHTDQPTRNVGNLGIRGIGAPWSALDALISTGHLFVALLYFIFLRTRT